MLIPDDFRFSLGMSVGRYLRSLSTVYTRSVLTAHRSNRPDHWDGLCQIGQLLDNFHHYLVEQNGSDCLQAIHYVVYRCHLVLLDKDESCPTHSQSRMAWSWIGGYLAPFYIHQMNLVNSSSGSAMMTALQTLFWNYYYY